MSARFVTFVTRELNCPQNSLCVIQWSQLVYFKKIKFLPKVLLKFSYGMKFQEHYAATVVSSEYS